LRRLEAGVALIDGAIFQAPQPAFDPGSGLPRYGILPRLHAFHIDIPLAAKFDAKVGGTADHVGGVGAGDHRFRRNASRVDTGTAEQLALDDRDLHAGLGQAPRQGRAGLAGTDDDRVVGCAHFNHPTQRGSLWMQPFVVKPCGTQGGGGLPAVLNGRSSEPARIILSDIREAERAAGRAAWLQERRSWRDVFRQLIRCNESRT